MLRAIHLLLLTFVSVRAELRIPGAAAYGAPDFDAMRLDKERGVMVKPNSNQSILWFGEIRKPGKLEAAVTVSPADERKR